MLLNSQQITEEIKRKIKKISRSKWQWKHNSKPMGCSKSCSKKAVYSNTILPQETIKASNGQPNFTPKTTGKRRRTKTTTKTKTSRRREIIEIQAETNGKERNNSKD